MTEKKMYKKKCRFDRFLDLLISVPPLHYLQYFQEVCKPGNALTIVLYLFRKYGFRAPSCGQNVETSRLNPQMKSKQEN